MTAVPGRHLPLRRDGCNYDAFHVRSINKDCLSQGHATSKPYPYTFGLTAGQSDFCKSGKQGHRGAISNHLDGASPIKALLFCARPAQVAGFVMPVLIDPIECVAYRSRPEIGLDPINELSRAAEFSPPILVNLDATPAVQQPICIIGVEAPIKHAGPNGVKVVFGAQIAVPYSTPASHNRVSGLSRNVAGQAARHRRSGATLCPAGAS